MRRAIVRVRDLRRDLIACGFAELLGDKTMKIPTHLWRVRCSGQPFVFQFLTHTRNIHVAIRRAERFFASEHATDSYGRLQIKSIKYSGTIDK
jgi:hypothetical protein